MPRTDRTTAPVLTTARLTLRGHRPSDLADCAAMWGDPIVVRHIGGRPSTVEDAWARILRYIGHWTALGYGFWIAHDTATGAFVGELGLADFKREIDPVFASSVEAGWVLAPAAHGRGYATEALSAVLAWSDAELGAPRVTCVIDPGNTASIKLAAKHGFRAFGTTTYHGEAIAVFERVAPTSSP